MTNVVKWQQTSLNANDTETLTTPACPVYRTHLVIDLKRQNSKTKKKQKSNFSFKHLQNLQK